MKDSDESLLGGHFEPVGTTDNATFYLVADRVLAIVPFTDTDDNDTTSLQSIRFQENFWRERGARGSCIVFMDRVLTQDRRARENYKTAPDASLIAGFALVTSSMLGRAVSSLFVGLSAPAVPTKVFPTMVEAMRWLTSLNQSR
ncbi:MAG TPA: hypothetical protein VFQ61_09030 [Polyangiaceae bacterium]|nr:hypothetical protein [Polyangiaceae bacterium]